MPMNDNARVFNKYPLLIAYAEVELECYIELSTPI